MRLTQVAPGVWTATAATWATLSTVVVADDGACLVVDPGITVQEVGALAAEIGSRGWRPVAGPVIPGKCAAGYRTTKAPVIPIRSW